MAQMAELEVPIPPLNEQKRIADKLDAVLARVDACRERLDRVPAILKHFRQAVLAAATSGKLTEEWQRGERTGLAEWPPSNSALSSLTPRTELRLSALDESGSVTVLRMGNIQDARLDWSDPSDHFRHSRWKSRSTG